MGWPFPRCRIYNELEKDHQKRTITEMKLELTFSETECKGRLSQPQRGASSDELGQGSHPLLPVMQHRSKVFGDGLTRAQSLRPCELWVTATTGHIRSMIWTSDEDTENVTRQKRSSSHGANPN